MRILQINKYPSVKGGSEVVLFETIELLKKEGHHVALFSTDEGNIIYEPTYTIAYPKHNSSLLHKATNLRSFFWNKKAACTLEQIILTEKPDIAHIHLYLNGLSQSILPTLKKYNIPVVMTLHDYRQICPSYLLLDRHQNLCQKCITGNYFNCALSRCSKGSLSQSILLTLEMYLRRTFFRTEKFVDQFVCVSNFQIQKYKEFNSSIASKSKVLHNPIEQPAKRSVCRGEYLIYFGRLSKEKGLDTLLSVMSHFPNIKLKIVGEGNDIPDKQLANVEFMGFRNKIELSELVRKAMFTIMPSESYETFGMACAESLALGTPVIVSNIGALPEIVEDTKNGFLFEVKNVLSLKQVIKQALAISDDQYHSMVTEGYRTIEKFSANSYICQLTDIYKSLLNKRK